MIITIIEILLINIIEVLKKNKNKIKNKKKYIQKKGEYLTKIGNCLSCHTIEGGLPFSGGLAVKTAFGIINTPNILINKTNIDLKNFIKIIKTGTSKNKILYPLFPYINYCKIKKSDVKNIFLFLKKIKSKNLINKKNNISFPIKYRSLLIGWRILFFKNKKNNSNNKYKSNIKRGLYLTKGLGHCDMCHTKINKIGKLNKNFKYKGKSEIEKWNSTNINNEREGIKNKSINEISKILKDGISKNKIINGVMSDIINKSLQYINKSDIISISRFIKSKINKKNIFKIKNKKNYKESYKKSKKVYKNKCKKCHGKNNLGNFPIYPKIIKNNKNFEYNKNLKNVFKKNKIINTKKNKYPAFMPFIKQKKYIKKYVFTNNKLFKY